MSTTASPSLTPVRPEELEKDLERVTGHEAELAYAQRVAKVLGNPTLLNRVNRRLGPNRQLDLLAILREHGVKLFRSEDVKRYKQAKIDEALKSVNQHDTWFAHTVLTLLAITLLSGLAALIGWVSGSVPLVSFLGFATSFAWPTGRVLTGKQIEAKWTRHALKTYPRDVPQEHLNLALKLQLAAPKVTFWVDEFTVQRRPRDPLLYVSLGDATYCIAVWGEPEFTAEPTD